MSKLQIITKEGKIIQVDVNEKTKKEIDNFAKNIGLSTSSFCRMAVINEMEKKQ
jgi:antitoxin component of RelBE/YafQ-DinJ toxin-antitoxin module